MLPRRFLKPEILIENDGIIMRDTDDNEPELTKKQLKRECRAFLRIMAKVDPRQLDDPDLDVVKSYKKIVARK